MDNELLLDAILNVGEGILVSGGEVFRVEDSIQRMLLSYDIKKADVFTITSAITVTIHTNSGKIFSNTRRIRQTDLNIKKLDMLNTLSRYICKNHPKPDYIFREYEKIMQCKEYPVLVKNIAYAIVSYSFCAIDKGNIQECFISSILGIILINLVDFFRNSGINKFMALIVSSYICGIAGQISASFFNLDPSKIALGNIMLLLPGLTITNAIRNLIAGDMIAGMLHLCDGALIGTCLAMGFALARF